MNVTIVIVDDHCDLLELWQLSLASLLPRTRLLLASTVAQALSHLDKNSVDLVVTDMEMPEQNGLDLIRIMKVKTPGIPILIVTGSTESQSMRKAEFAGVSAWLQKPVLPDELVAAITELLGQDVISYDASLSGRCVQKQ